MLNEVNQSQKDKYCMIILTRNLVKIETESRIVVVRV